MGEYCVTFDLETRNKIQDMPGRFRDDKVKQLNISCLCAVKFDADVALEDPTKALEEAERLVYWQHKAGDIGQFLKLLDGALVVGGFNVFGFDFPVLSRHYQHPSFGGNRRYRNHTFKTQDPFSRLRDATGVWYKLDTLLKTNGLEPKTADGLQAIAWWHEQKLEPLQDYCMADVELCTQLMLRTTLLLPDGDVAPPHAFSFQSAIQTLRDQRRLVECSKRKRSASDGEVTP